MRTPRRPELLRVSALAAIAASATALVLAGPVGGVGESAARAAARAWHAVFGDRPQQAFSRRVIVVLSAPSLAERVAAADTPSTPAEQRRWSADALAGQQLLVAGLRERGIQLRREFIYTRTVNGFSALIDARAIAELERTPGVTGVYPVRAVYPAQVSNSAARLRPNVSLPGFDGRGVVVALLDTGVDRAHPTLRERLLPGWDAVGRDRIAAAEAKPDEPGRLETHGTRMASLVADVSPGAGVRPIRIMGWQETAAGTFAIVGRGDQLIAGIERSVDPDVNGDVADAARIALAPVVEPYAAFSDSPEARAVAGASALGTLVVAAAGNDGHGAIAFASVAAPAAAPEALAVGAIDTRENVLEADLRLEVAGESVFDESVRVLGAAGPTRSLALEVAGLLGPTIEHPGRAAGVDGRGEVLGDFFDARGVSRVAGRAVLIAGDGPLLDTKARNAAEAGAAAMLVYGSNLPAGALDTSLPAVAIPADTGRETLEGLRNGRPVELAVERAEPVQNVSHLRVAPFSSGGLAFDGSARPDLVAPGVGLAIADGTATGSSAAAAVAAGAAALVVQARPRLTAAELKSVLVGSAARIERVAAAAEPVIAQGAGLVDPAAAVATELAVEPSVLAFGRADRARWKSTHPVTLRNLSSRPLEIGFGFAPDQSGEPTVTFTAEPARVSLGPGASVVVNLTASAAERFDSGASGVLVVAADGARPVRVPWAVARRPADGPSLVHSVELSNWEFAPSSAAPAVLAFRAGRVASGQAGETIEPVGLVDVELWTAEGKRLGVLARLRDLLPGRYAFGLTGRDPEGKILPDGVYVIRLQAWAVDASDGDPPSTAEAVFRIKESA
jgi:minor extracellular serine protease Vpr